MAALLGLFVLSQFAAFAQQSVTLAWDASPDPTVIGYNVYYGGSSGNYTNKVDVGNATSITVSNLVPGATYYFVVTAYNAAGLESDPSNEATYTVPLPAPAIALSAPSDGSTYLAPASISLSANVTANGHTISQVQFYNGTTLLGSDSSAPYNFAWNNVSAGVYGLTARLVYDGGTTLDSAAVGVTVTNSLPVVSLTAPTDGSSYVAPATLNLSASVITNGHSITQVQFYNGSTLLGSDSAPPYTYSWSGVSAGSYSLKARLVYDNGLNLYSAVSTVTVTNPPPLVTLSAPANGSFYTAPATLNLGANVTANGHTISKVQYFNGANLVGQSSSAPYSYTWSGVGAGSYSLSARLVYDGSSTLDSAAATVTVTNALPVIALLSPTNNTLVSAPALVTCSASVLANGHTISKVQFFASSNLLGEVTSAPYSLNWNCTNSGLYYVAARLVYDSGSRLDTASVLLQVRPAPPVNTHVITIVGQGTLSPNLSAQALVVGDVYTVTAVPDNGQQFAGWNGSVDSSSPTVTFQVTSDFTLKANFVPVRSDWVTGSYYGLFYESNQVEQASSGAFFLTSSKGARYSGHLQLGSKRYSFHGVFDVQGQATNSLPRAGASPIALAFRMVGGPQAEQIQGTVSADGWVAELTADRQLFDKRFNPATLQGTYTLLIPGQGTNDPALPTGHSYGVVRIDSGGSVRLAGSLADGTRFSQSAIVSAAGQWGLYVPLYRGQGLLLSWLAFTNRPTDDLNGALSWIKPADDRARYYADGFAYEGQALGSAYVAPQGHGAQPLALSTATLSFFGGDLGAGFSNLLTQTPSGALGNASDSRLSLGFSKATGAFRGSVIDPSSGRAVPFSGVVFQKTQSGYGYLLGDTQSSAVELGQ